MTWVQRTYLVRAVHCLGLSGYVFFCSSGLKQSKYVKWQKVVKGIDVSFEVFENCSDLQSFQNILKL